MNVRSAVAPLSMTLLIALLWCRRARRRGCESSPKRIPVGQRGACVICESMGIQTGSEFEWPCALLGNWVCETHCAEIEAEFGSAVRQAVATRIGWQASPELLRNKCSCCPYAARVS